MTTITNTATTPSVPTFEALLTKMMPHFRYFVGKVLRLRRDRYHDAIQDLVGMALETYQSLVRRGKEVFYTPIMKYTIQHYRAGRRFVGYNTTDVLGHQAQFLGRSTTYSIDDCAEDTDRRHCITDKQPDVLHTVQIRMDFSDWYDRLPVRDQWIATDLAMGETTNAVAKKYGVSAALISIKRKTFANSWKNFIDPEEKGMLVPA